MGAKAVIFQNQSGGWATDKKIGIKNSHAFSQAFDFRKSPSQMSVLPAPAREDNGIVKDLILNEKMANNGVIYAFGNAGYFYKRTTAGVWSVEGQLDSGCAGMDYRKDSDSIYLCSNKYVALYNPVTGTGSPTLVPTEYGPSFSTYDNTANAGFNVNSHQTGSSQTTQIKVATNPLNETSANVRYFQSDIEPLNKIGVNIITKGTGNWTLTLHDGLNNVLATTTVANASLNNNSINYFNFTNAPNGQVRIYVSPNARTYHLHLTSTVADGTVSSTQLNDLSTCDLEVWADRLVQTNNGLHPMGRFLQYEIIGNANYISVWEPLSPVPTNAEWLRHRLTFPQEYEVCGLDFTNEFAVIAAEQNTTQTTSLPQMGQIFFWDGIDPTYNYNVPIPEGSPQGLHTYKNVVYYYAGGDWYAITSPLTQPVKLRSMPNSATEFFGSNTPITVYPYAATVRRGVHLMTYPCVTTNTGIQFGVYSWGSVDKNYPDSFGYNYVISTGSQNYTAQNNLQLGMVQSFGDLLHISWRDTVNGGYGIDVVSNASPPASYAKWQGLIIDNGYAARLKSGAYMECYFDLPPGASIKLGYSIDRTTFVTDTQSYTSTNLWQGQPNYAKFNITTQNGGRFNEFQPQIEVTCDSTVTTPPNIYMVSVIYDDNKEESLT